MRRPFLSLITLTALVLVLAPSATAQGTVGTVSGTIRERGSERALAGVQVRVVGTQRAAISDATGNYRIAGIPIANSVSFYYQSEYSLHDTSGNARTCVDMRADCPAVEPPTP